ncbi:hypothetical protein HP2RS_01660 [Helicobacter pylori]|jgi:hypothetical protein|nr:hypothetical protein HP2RS_01660 [Helicobacter pylori]OUC11124.1 hypothetical protein X568_02275 [Helicobacter pylori SS1]
MGFFVLKTPLAFLDLITRLKELFLLNSHHVKYKEIKELF